MSDNEDANARRAARPSTPPFRGPAGPAGRPPLAPHTGSPGSAPKATPSQGSPRPPSAAPFAVPPAGPRNRPSTPPQGQRRPAVTPSPADLPSSATTQPTTAGAPTEAELAAIPAYGSAPPKSVAATLKSISEFTIVEEAAEPAAAEPPPEASATYEAPTVTARTGDVDTGPEYAPSLADTVEWRATPPDLDALVTVPPFDPDQAAPRQNDGVPTPLTLLALGAEPNEDVIAAAFDATAGSMFAGPTVVDSGESATGESALIGGSPASRLAAECLEEIAQGIRAGEIAVPAIPPGAEPPAILATVLAALLAPRQ